MKSSGLPSWRSTTFPSVTTSVTRPVARNSVRAGTDPQAVAAVMIAALEGGILLSRAHRSAAYFQHVAQHLAQYIERDIAA